MAAKPIKIFYSTISNRFYATQFYKVDGKLTTITGKKFDVTDEIANLIDEHQITFEPLK